MRTKRCAWVQSRLPLLAGNELVGTDRRRVERHLIGCTRCQSRLVALQKTIDVLQIAAAEPPLRPSAASVWPALARQIQESRRSPAPWVVSLPRIALWSAACLVAGMLTSAWLLQPPHVSPVVPMVAGAAPQAPLQKTATQPAPPSPRLASASRAAKAPKSKPESVVKETSTVADNNASQRTSSAETDRSSSTSSESRDTH